MAKQINTSSGLVSVLDAAVKNQKVMISEKMIDKLTIISFFDDEWQHNKMLLEEDQLSKRAIIMKAYELFKVDFSVLYRIWTEAQDKLGLTSIISKAALSQYIIEKSMLMIDREEAKYEPDNKAIAMLMRNLTTINLNMPEEQEEREPLPIPIFIFNPELLANHENIAKVDMVKVLAELRASKEDSIKKNRPKIGEYVDFEDK